MTASFNKELFMELANLIKSDMALYVNTRKEMEHFAQEYPEQYQLLLRKVQAALELSITGDSFEALTKEEMNTLQGSGVGSDGTSAVWIAAKIMLGFE